MARAFVITSKQKMFFEAASGKYRYWYTPGKRLMLQISAKEFEAFRASKAGKRIESYVDIFKTSGGWYEITARDWATPRFGGPRFLLDLESQGLQLWIRQFNLAFVAQVNENYYKVHTEYVSRRDDRINAPRNRTATPQQINALVAKFARA